MPGTYLACFLGETGGRSYTGGSSPSERAVVRLLAEGGAGVEHRRHQMAELAGEASPSHPSTRGTLLALGPL